MAAQPKPLIVIVGQTASGKSALALKLAEQIGGEIICADSRTVYKGMDIGTAKPTSEEQARVTHHLLDVVEPNKRFTVADFKHLATEAIEDISKRGKVSIMVGGTGLYIDALLYDYQFSDEEAPRNLKNPRHLAADVLRHRSELRANTLVIGLGLDKETLRERVTGRVERMVADGLVDEVKMLVEKYGQDIPALNAPGYKPFIEYLNGTLTLEEAKELFIKNDLSLAKRQKTWFKRNKSIHWFDEAAAALAWCENWLIDNRKTGKKTINSREP